MNSRDNDIPEKQIRAFYTKDFIRVYQAYSDEIADSAISKKTFISPPFSMTRMTWIKPSFLWMMYRSGWGLKGPGQKRILAIDITHHGFEKIIKEGILSNHHDTVFSSKKEKWREEIKNTNIIIQWDPERDIHLNKLNYRTIQIGLRNQAVIDYCEEWIIDIQDATTLTKEIYALISEGQFRKAEELLPHERVYNLKYPS